nr:copia protein [Tanacetum cinerariifolium]
MENLFHYGSDDLAENFVISLEPTPSSRPTKVEVPKELPKVSMVNTSLKKLKHHLASFDVVIKERTTATTIKKYKVIKKLKEIIKSLSGNIKEDKIKKELEEIETINIELDHRVTKLIAENEHLKQTYKQLYDSIKSSRIQSKENFDDLINQVNLKSAENSDLNASLQEKVLVITTLKYNLRKLKGNSTVDDVVPSLPIDPELLKVDVAPLALKLQNNRTVHSNYLRHTQEETTILREIVEQGRSLNTFNASLDYASVNLSTSASKSQPSGNTKKDKIQQTPISTKKSNIEAHPRIVRSSLINKKYAIKPKDTVSVQHSKLNVNFDLQCVMCNGFLFFDNHDSFVLDFINNVNARVKSKSVKKTVKRNVWKPTGKVFTNIGYIWRPTCRTFTIVGNACPLTRFTTTAKVLLRKPIALESNTPKPMVTLVYSRKLKASRNNVPVSKFKNNKSLSGCLNCAWVFGLWLLQAHDWRSLSAHQFHQQFSGENLGKLQPKADIVIFIGLGPTLHKMTPATISSGLVPNPPSSTPFVPTLRTDWDIFFEPLFDELLTLPPSVDHPAPEVIAPIPEVVALEHAASTGSPSSTTVDQDAPSPNALSQSCWIEAMQEELHEFEHLEKEVYNSQPDGFVDPDNPNHVYKLKKSLYGLKQGPHAWYDMLSSFLISQDFSKGSMDHTLFIYRNGNDLLLDSSIALTAFADVNHAGCQDTRHSTSGSL